MRIALPKNKKYMYCWLFTFYLFVDGNNESSARSGASPRHHWDMAFVYNSFFFSTVQGPKLLRKLLPSFMGRGSHFLWQLDCIKSVTIITLLLLLTLWVTYNWNDRGIDSIPTYFISTMFNIDGSYGSMVRLRTRRKLCNQMWHGNGLRKRWLLFSTRCRDKTKYLNCGRSEVKWQSWCLDS